MLVLRSLAFNKDGQAYSAGHLNGSFALARFNQDGSFDQTFGSSGIVSGLGGTDADAIYILKNGDILLTGYQASMPIAVSKYTKDGSLINSFADHGFLYFNFYQNNVGQSILELDNGNVLVCGVTNNAGFFEGGSTAIGVAMIDQNGNFVSSFGSDASGKIMIGDHAFPWWSFLSTQIINNEQKILVAGTVTVGSVTQMSVTRIN